jgi:hypothetical protein|tara:strand:- start:4 stop:495 length:492 start_codon:yes stop_codon:yes gene_type:complete
MASSQISSRVQNLQQNIKLDELSLTIKKSNLACLLTRGSLDSLKADVKEAEGPLATVTAKERLLKAEVELKTSFIASKQASVARITLKESSPGTWPKFSPPDATKFTNAIARATKLKEKKQGKLDRVQKRLDRLKNPKKKKGKRKRAEGASKKTKKTKIEVTG